MNGATKESTRGKELIEEVKKIFSQTERNFNMEFWNGEVISYTKNPDFTLRFHDKEAFKKLLLNPDILKFAQAYMNQAFDIEGDIFKALKLKETLSNIVLSGKEKFNLFMKSASLPSLNLHTKEKDKENISHHYDVSNEFYKLFLEESMAYSCAYFKEEGEDLTTAQENKVDHICKKLRLKEGEKLLDIGCGWGTMILWAAKQYGVEAHGITISEEQYKYVKQRIKEENLEGKCFVELKDYRDVQGEGVFDKIVSIGMFEHVGIKNLSTYFNIANRLLKEDGLFLNHGITHSKSSKISKEESEFIEKYIFPGGELHTVSGVQEIMEDCGFEVYDVESLREHYFKTLTHWVNNLQDNKENAIKATSEMIYRTWLLYMTGCAINFEAGFISVYQILLGKTRKDPSFNIPLTREYIYLDR